MNFETYKPPQQFSQSSGKQRRDALVAWMAERPAHSGLTAGEIADVSGIFDGMTRPSNRARQDLLILLRAERVEHDGGSYRRRWYATALEGQREPDA